MSSIHRIKRKCREVRKVGRGRERWWWWVLVKCDAFWKKWGKGRKMMKWSLLPVRIGENIKQDLHEPFLLSGNPFKKRFSDSSAPLLSFTLQIKKWKYDAKFEFLFLFLLANNYRSLFHPYFQFSSALLSLSPCYYTYELRYSNNKRKNPSNHRVSNNNPINQQHIFCFNFLPEQTRHDSAKV